MMLKGTVKLLTPIAPASGRNPDAKRINGASESPAAEEAVHQESDAVLMERVVGTENMREAYRRVVENKGSAGIDRMSVEDLSEHLRKHWPRIKEELLSDRYKPKPVLRVEIPKPGGKGMRKLGIPVVVDRMIQQALAQVLNPIFEPGFSDGSYGFREGRSALQAVEKAREYVALGANWVVDIDLEKFFDRVNHDILMARVARKVSDKRVLRLIRGFLTAGVMADGLVSPTREGTPQGGPLSPLLSNILLDDLDKELERRGLAFCRYADDCNIYVGSRRAGERVKRSITRFLTERLKLKVNEEKSAVDRPSRRKFLGYTILGGKEVKLKPATQSVERLKEKVRVICRIGRGRNIRSTIQELTRVLRGWVNYFKLSQVKGIFEELDEWIRRKVRCILWRQWKRCRARCRNLIKRGIDSECARAVTANGRGAWWHAGAFHMNKAFPIRFFEELGLFSLSHAIAAFQSHS